MNSVVYITVLSEEYNVCNSSEQRSVCNNNVGNKSEQCSVCNISKQTVLRR